MIREERIETFFSWWEAKTSAVGLESTNQHGARTMKWLLKDHGVERPASLPGHIERRLRFALARFGVRIEKLIVFLQDRNGPRGGVDKVCRILAKVRGCGAIMATVADSDWTTAVDRATTRIGHTVSRQVGRLRDREPRASRGVVAGMTPYSGRRSQDGRFSAPRSPPTAAG